ncbi:hypothetical protein SAMN05216559_0602 [Halomicrobium zhouii]|uniref:Uncharacterized protein n=1 Tax=Halomicrobium zhouii TaxID=767519 RepID=A0A1I6KE27_9EURY|nr:hypothetical protein [Halomicrobium zhouii]SFR89268.1 hypothetical protein SAMN05216559_0602 [Halomicrobium zhouii]
MFRNSLLTAGVFVAVICLLTGSVAAAPAASATDETSGAVGPPGDLPDPVPEFVTSILDAIGQFLDGTLGGNPGDEVSESAGNGVDA